MSRPRSRPGRAAALGLAALVLLVLAARTLRPSASRGAAPPTDASTPRRPSAPPATGLVVGVFELARAPAVDGDTVRLSDGRLVRVISLDTEETFKSAADREAAGRDFAAYARAKRADARYPVKYGTPAGEAAAAHARALLDDVREVRIERDRPDASIVDAYGRLLGHVVLLAPDGERDLAEAMIRAGWSPYFVKYGRSVRHDDAYRAAEADARAAGRGVWGEGGPDHYPDYAERLAWWHARADQVDRWRALPPDPRRVTLDDERDVARLEDLVGGRVEALGVVTGRRDQGNPWILYLASGSLPDLKVVVFDPAVWSALDLVELANRYVVVEGRLERWRDRLEVKVEDPHQVRVW